MALKKYYKQQTTDVKAVQITLPNCELNYQKWGGQQKACSGDWIVQAGQETYTIEQQSFSNTYQLIDGDRYRKITPVWAEQAETDGSITTKEGLSSYQAGDYLVYNNSNKTDGYSVAKAEFEKKYQSTDSKPMEMSIENYISTRLDKQIAWYDKKATQNQRYYRQLQILAIILGSAIPLLTVLSLENLEALLRFVIALFGSVIAVISGVLSLYKFQEHWVKYRATAESLNREKIYFLTQSALYSDDPDENKKLFIDRCENIMSSENSEWKSNLQPQAPARIKK